MTLRDALARSINTVAVRLNMTHGPRKTVEAAHRLGISSELRPDASLALGTSEVTLLELTGAYNVLANGGRFAEPYVVRQVRSLKGGVLFARQAPTAAQVVAPAQVTAMNDMLNGALVSGTGKRAAIPLHAAAGKTGTTQSFRDAWFIGYTAKLVTGVWLGNDDNSPTRKATGGGLPVEVWTRFMRVAHQNVPVAELPGSQPQGGFLSGLFGGNARSYAQSNRPQISDANPSYVPPVNSPNPYPQARTAATQTAVRPEASSGC